MKNIKKQLCLILAAVLMSSLLCTPALAATGTLNVAATPIEYSLYVAGKDISLWVYGIDGGVYFKLRDLAMALKGTEKQFGVSWDGSKKAVSLTTGTAYTPVGGELSEPSEPSNDTGAVAHSPTTLFYIDNRQIPIRAYIVNGTHYIMLSDLTANLMFATGYDEEMRMAKISTKAYYTDLYAFSLPEGWIAKGSAYDLQFTRSGEPVGTFIIRNYDPDKPISQFRDNHRETLSSENLSDFEDFPTLKKYPVAKAIIRATQPAAANNDSYVDELHIYIMLADSRCAFDFCFDSAKVDEQTAMEIVKGFSPNEAAIQKNTAAAEWALAIQKRDGRAQYELLSAELQAEFKDYYEAVNWVTGVSSPWVNSWTIEVSGSRAIVFYEGMTSEGFAGYTIDNLTFSEENEQLKISDIDGVNDFSGHKAQNDATGSNAGDTTSVIFEDVNTQLDMDVEFTNGWRSPLVDPNENGAGGKSIIAQVGALKSDPEQGVAVVCHQNKDSDQYVIDEQFLTPSKHGAIKIESLGAKDFTMSVVAEDGYKWIFNIYNGFYNNDVENADPTSDKQDVLSFVVNFGEKLKMVTLTAPQDIAAESIEEHYSEFVTPELLALWESDPQNALGRRLSSPWPDRIEITDTETAGNGAYTVSGEIVEVTSTGPAAKYPVTLKVTKQDDRWLISGVTIIDESDVARY